MSSNLSALTISSTTGAGVATDALARTDAIVVVGTEAATSNESEPPPVSDDRFGSELESARDAEVESAADDAAVPGAYELESAMDAEVKSAAADAAPPRASDESTLGSDSARATMEAHSGSDSPPATERDGESSDGIPNHPKCHKLR